LIGELNGPGYNQRGVFLEGFSTLVVTGAVSFTSSPTNSLATQLINSRAAEPRFARLSAHT